MSTLRQRKERITIKGVDSKGFIPYDTDNLYPQRIKTLVSGSGRASACEEIFLHFVFGGGFYDEAFANTMANEDQTFDELLHEVNQDLGRYRGFALHVSYDANGATTALYCIPFEHVRLGGDKLTKRVNGKILVSDNWNNQYGTLKASEITIYDSYDPTKIASVVSEDPNAITKHNGQVFYYSIDGQLTYPTALIEPVAEDVISDGYISLYQSKALDNGFHNTSFLAYGGTLEQANRQALENIIESSMGVDAAGNVFLVTGIDPDKFKQLDIAATDVDKQFVVISDSVQERIRKIYQVPKVLAGDSMPGSLGATKEHYEAQQVYNAKTSPYRLMIERVIEKLTANWAMPLPEDKSIAQYNRYTDEQIPAELFSDLTTNERRELIGYEAVQTGQEDKPTLATVIGVGGVQSMVAIVESPTLSPDQKSYMLQSLFGLDEVTSNQLAGNGQVN